MTSRELNQDVSKVKREAEQSPLIVSTRSIADLLSMPESAEIEFKPIRTQNVVSRVHDLS